MYFIKFGFTMDKQYFKMRPTKMYFVAIAKFALVFVYHLTKNKIYQEKSFCGTEQIFITSVKEKCKDNRKP